MNKILKVLSCLACVFVFCFLAIGYAAVQDTLTVSGSVTIEKQEEKIIITYKDTKAYKLDSDGVLTIKETYIGDDNKTYRVIGIDANGFSSSQNEVGYDASTVTSVIIPKSVETIGDNAFTGCSNLKSFTVDSENKFFIAIDQVLFNKEGTSLLRYPPSYKYPSPMLYHISQDVASINQYAFCDLPASTVVVTNKDWERETKSSWFGATSACLILVAPEHYSTIQSFVGNSENGYTITSDSTVANTNLVFTDLQSNSKDNREWAAVDENGQFTIPSGICNASSPSVVKVATVEGDINREQLDADLENDSVAVIGGGKWSHSYYDNLNKTNKDVHVTINDGYFSNVLRIDYASVVINGGIYNIYAYVGDPKFAGGASSVVINGGEWLHTGQMKFPDLGQTAAALLIKGGDFYWSGITGPSSLEIIGGKFRFDPTAYVNLAECTVINNDDGTWTVQQVASS